MNKKKPEERIDARISIVMRASDARRIRELAQREDVKLSHYLRRILLRHLEGVGDGRAAR